jgi:ribonuclease Z
MDLSLLFAGTGGSVPTRGRGLPGTLLHVGGEQLLVDCGEGTQRQLLRAGGLPDVGTILLTHHHSDHWLGLPGLLKSFDLRDRTAPLDLFGPPGTERLLRAVLGLVGRTRYPLHVEDLDPGDVLDFDGFSIESLPVRHRDLAFGYAYVEPERPGRLNPDRARELGVTDPRDFGRLQRGETVGGVAPAQVLGAPRPGRKVVLSGDTGPCDMIRVAATGADVLIHEATFCEDERERAIATGHSTAAMAAEIAQEAGVRLLVLTHLSSRYISDDVLDEALPIFGATVAPRDLDVLHVPYADKGEPALERRDGRRVPAEAGEA